MPSFESLKKDYEYRYSTAKIQADQAGIVSNSGKFIVQNRSRFEQVAKEIGCPWCFVGILSVMEAGHSFRGWLANGNPLTGKTYDVPAGLEVPGKNPPYDWAEAAVVSLKLKGYQAVKEWNIPYMLYCFEVWNGWGYYNRSHLSQYVWASTQYEEPGRYVKDGPDGWDDNALSDQAGCAALLLWLSAQGLNVLEIPGKESPVSFDSATWLEEFRHEDGEKTVVAWDRNGNSVGRLPKTRNKSEIAAFKALFPNAATELIAPPGKPIPTAPTPPPPPPPVVGFTRAKALEFALAESAKDISWRGNGVAKKYTKKFEPVFGTGRFSWCAAFVTWCCEQAGLNIPVKVPGDADGYTFALCEAWQQWGKRQGFWIEGGSNVSPQAGDIVLFDWDGATHPDGASDWEDHIGFVIRGDTSSVYCAEGNVNDATARKNRDKSLIQGYIRIPDGYKFA
jgi:lysozyme family protein